MLPFRTGMKVSGREFCGRQHELAQLREIVQSAGRVYVVGDRRIGKTSLVLEAVRSQAKMRLVYVDLMAVKTMGDVSQRLAQAVVGAERQRSRVVSLIQALASMRPTLTVDPTTNLPAVSFAPGSGDRPETLDSIFALLATWERCVVVFDEFQDIQSLPEQDAVTARLRGLVQHQEHIAFVYCGSVRSRMEELFTDSDAPFFHAAMRLSVGPIERPVFKRFLERKFRSGGRRLAKGVLDEVLDVCHDNPGDTQRLCTALWQVTSEGDTICAKDLAQAWTMLFAMESDYYEVILHNLSPQQTQALRALARAGGSSNLSREFVESTGISLLPSVAKALSGLVAKRIVHKVGTSYSICDPFLACWLSRP